MTHPDQLVEHARFAHGYVLRLGGDAPRHTEPWRALAIGDAELRLHPRTLAVDVVDDSNNRQVVLCGQPLDVARGSSDPHAVAVSVLDALTGGSERAVLRLMEVSGRWTAFLREDTRVTVVLDSHGTQPAFWATGPSGWRRRAPAAVASHAVLAADVVGASIDERALDLFRGIRDFRPRGTIFMPGLTSTHEGVRPVFPNHVLELDLRRPDAARHRRVWPVEQRAERPVDEVFAEFATRFDTLTRLTSDLGRTAISLTAGLDSRTTLVGALPHLTERDFTFTYLNPRDLVGNAGVRRDLFGASELAFLAGLQHRVIRWRPPEPEDPFAVAYSESFPALQSSLGAATAMFHDLPHDIVELASNLTETGTFFYPEQSRVAGSPTPEVLARVTLGPGVLDRREYVAEFARLVDYTEFTTAALKGYDLYDLTYWEHRLGKWGARKFQEGDMGHRVALPFADRRLIELMLSVPAEDRFAKTLLHRYLARRPDLADLDPVG